MRRSISLYLAAASLLAAQTAAEEPFKLQTTTRMVIELVTVTGKDGRPVEGLSAEDFVVTENGVPQKVAVCEYQRFDLPGETKTAKAPPAAASSSSTANPPAARAGVLPYRDRRLLALYFDRSGQSGDLYRAVEGAVKFIRSSMTASDLVAILEYSRGIRRLRQDFTADKDLLLETVAEMSRERPEEADLATAFGADDAQFNVFSTDRQLAALQKTVADLGRLNQRALIVYFASGAPFYNSRNLASLRSLVNASVRANVSIFTVDTRGLAATPPMGDASQPSPGGIGMYTGASAAAVSSALESSQDALYALAADTGGKALLDTNDLSAGIVQAQAAFASHYVIGYYTTNTLTDGKYRKVSITLGKDSTAKLAYRRGYYGRKEFDKFNAADKEQQLEEALALEDPISELTIALEVNYFQLNRAEYYVPVTLKIPGSELVLARKGGAERAVIDFIGEIKTDFGRTVQNVRDKVDIKLSGATVADLAHSPIEYDSGYTLVPGDYIIKVLARDGATGRIGTYISRFRIPNLNREEQRIALSSLVLSGQRISLDAALYTAGKDKEQVNNPLVSEGQKLVPSVTRVFARNGTLFVYLQAYQQLEAAAHPLVAYATFFRDGAKVFETLPAEFTAAQNNRLKTMPLKLAIPLAQFVPGQYDCQVTVLDRTAKKAGFRQTSIFVVP